MSIVGFVPDPEVASSVVAWVQALADEDETAEYLCFETGFDGRTTQAIREALGEEGEGAAKPMFWKRIHPDTKRAAANPRRVSRWSVAAGCASMA